MTLNDLQPWMALGLSIVSANILIYLSSSSYFFVGAERFEFL